MIANPTLEEQNDTAYLNSPEVVAKFKAIASAISELDGISYRGINGEDVDKETDELTFVNMVNEAFSGDPTEGLPVPPEVRESLKKLSGLIGTEQKVCIQLQFINVAVAAGLLPSDVEFKLYKAVNNYLCAKVL